LHSKLFERVFLYRRLLTLTCVLITLCSHQSSAQLNTYTFSQSVNPFQPITATNIYVSGTGEYQVALPFVFKVDTLASDSLWINANGYAGLKRVSTLPSNSYAPLSINKRYNGVLSPLAGAIIPSSASSALGSIKYTTEGTAPSRIFKVEWRNMNTGQFFISFQLWLYEGSQRVDFVYSTLTFNPGATRAAMQIGLRCVDTNVSAGQVINRTTNRQVGPSGGGTTLSLTGTDPGLRSIETCELINPTGLNPMYVIPSGLTYTWTPGAACNNITGNTGTLPDSITECYGKIIKLTPSGTPAGLTYQWQYSTNNGSTWTDLTTGTGNGTYLFCETLPITGTVLYRRKNTCTQSAAVTYTNNCKLKNYPALPVPYTESFETPTAASYILPDCMLAFNERNFTNSAFSFVNSGARSGRFSASYTWLVTPGIYLEAGKQYRISNYYTFTYGLISSGSDSVQFAIGTFPHPDSITSTTTSTVAVSHVEYLFRRASMTFTVPTTGIYFGGMRYYAAAGNDIYIDDIEIIEVPLQDASIDSFIAPVKPGCFATAVDVTARLSNKGRQNISNIPVYYSVNGVQYGPETVTATITPGNSIDYTFTQRVDLSGIYKDYSFKAWAKLPGDGSAYNDSAFAFTIQTDTLKAVPYLQNFDVGSAAYTKWHVPSSNNGFYTGSLRNHSTGLLSMVLSYAAPNTRDSLATPPVGTIHTNSFLTFDYRVVDYAGYTAQTMLAGDTVFLVAKAGCGTQVDTLLRIHRGNQFTTTTFKTIPPISLAAYAGDYVRFSYLVKRGSSNYATNTFFDLENFKVSDLNMRDMGIYYLEPLGTLTCTGSGIPVKIALKNNGGLPAANFPVHIAFSPLPGTTTYNYTNTLNYGETDTITINVATPSVAGMSTLKAYTALSNDTSNYNDTVSANIYVATPPVAPALTNRGMCTGDSILLNGAANDSTLTFYYNSNTAANPLSLTTPITVRPASTTTYYASNAFTLPARAGKTEFTSALYSFFSLNWGINFDVVNNMILDSVALYPTGTGSLTFSIRSCASCSNQVILGTYTHTFTAATGTKIMVPVGLLMTKGKGYIMQLDSYNGITDLKRDYPFSGYPVKKPSAPIIVNTAAGNSPAMFDGYYYFYDLVTRSVGCESGRSATTISVNSTPRASFTVSPNVRVVTLTNTSTGGGTYAWDFGDGTTSTQTSPVHTYPANGTYPIKLVITNACGQDSVIQSVVINNVGIQEHNAAFPSLKLYPNPAQDKITLSFEADNHYLLHVSIYNLVGVKTFEEMVPVKAGSNSIERNISHLPNGHYLIQLRNGAAKTTLPLVITGK